MLHKNSNHKNRKRGSIKVIIKVTPPKRRKRKAKK